jgi:hypothetical protein
MAAIDTAVAQAMTVQLSACEMPRSVKMGEVAEDIETLVDFSSSELLQAFGAKAFAGKGAHD